MTLLKEEEGLICLLFLDRELNLARPWLSADHATCMAAVARDKAMAGLVASLELPELLGERILTLLLTGRCSNLALEGP